MYNFGKTKVIVPHFPLTNQKLKKRKIHHKSLKQITCLQT